MNLFNTSSRIVITCSNRISLYLQQETEALGYTVEKVFKTGLELQGSMAELYSPEYEFALRKPGFIYDK